MITSFSIENFRLFANLRIDGLKAVNLFVGQNNAGKSALLESIDVFANNASPATLLGLISSRQETWNDKAEIEFRELFGNPLRHLFLGHKLPNIGENGISLASGSAASEKLRIFTAAFRTIVNEDGDIQRTRISEEDYKTTDSDIELVLVAQEGDRFRRIMGLDDNISRLRRISPTWLSRDSEKRCPIQIVPTRNMEPQKVASLWDVIGLTDLADEVISGLQLIEPSIEAIQFVQSTAGRTEARVALVRTRGSKEPLPLRSMGDGLTRLFHIILALASAKDGILLVDEFENGLHWSVQDAVWKTVFRLATNLNVQLFATTHSRDCIAGFESAWKENESKGAFYRLDVAREGAVRVRAYHLNTLSDAIESSVEVR